MKKYRVVRWQDGECIKEDGTTDTARHLYRGTVWCGVLSGMTISMEKEILNKLNIQ